MRTLAAAALAGVASALTNSQSTDLANANQASSAMNGLSTATHATSAAFKGAEALDSALKVIEVADPFFAVIGMVTTIVGWFQPSDLDQILAAIKEVSDKIDYLQGDMQSYFEKVMTEVKQTSCFNAYGEYEQTIKLATDRLNAYYKAVGTSNEDPAKRAFLEVCFNAQCDQAAAALLDSLNGNTGLLGCDMLDILYQGDASSNDYYIGWRDQVISKASYLLNLINLGVTAQSAYTTLTNPDHQDTAYLLVQDYYGSRLESAAQRIQKYDDKCQSEWYDNFKINAERIIRTESDAGADNQTMSLNVTETMYNINPYRYWQSEVYDNIGGNNVHQYICYNCAGWLHWNNRYNIVVSSIATNVNGDTSIVNSSYIRDQSNDKSDADVIANRIWDRYCMVGVHVIARYVDEWTYSYFDSAYSQNVGSHHTIVSWATQGWCNGNDDDNFTVMPEDFDSDNLQRISFLA